MHLICKIFGHKWDPDCAQYYIGYCTRCHYEAGINQDIFWLDHIKWTIKRHFNYQFWNFKQKWCNSKQGKDVPF